MTDNLEELAKQINVHILANAKGQRRKVSNREIWHSLADPGRVAPVETVSNLKQCQNSRFDPFALRLRVARGESFALAKGPGRG